MSIKKQAESQAIVVQALCRVIKPLLAGHHPRVQSAVLADLLAMWLAGHLDHAVREEVLAEHIELVRKLVPVNEAIIESLTKVPHGKNH